MIVSFKNFTAIKLRKIPAITKEDTIKKELLLSSLMPRNIKAQIPAENIKEKSNTFSIKSAVTKEGY